jgi:hypothetical protein
MMARSRPGRVEELFPDADRLNFEKQLFSDADGMDLETMQRALDEPQIHAGD